MKRCSNCDQEKPLSEFFRDSHAPDGHMYHCKACRQEYYHQRYRAENPEPTHPLIRYKTVGRGRAKRTIIDYSHESTQEFIRQELHRIGDGYMPTTRKWEQECTDALPSKLVHIRKQLGLANVEEFRDWAGLEKAPRNLATNAQRRAKMREIDQWMKRQRAAHEQAQAEAEQQYDYGLKAAGWRDVAAYMPRQARWEVRRVVMLR